ncbi:MAG: hypothetical protein JHC88_07900 [Niveispirillum sp.]|nr:hypothetical protein [Niveispirillum sp.]
MLEEQQSTVILGDEFDQALKERLLNVLAGMNALNVALNECLLAGSQEIQRTVFHVDGRMVTVEAETYIGLQITGPTDLIVRIFDAVRL